jgi:hypothetical protein
VIVKEDNSQRKSLRVAIPLMVEIAGTNYAVKNWSTTGVRIVGLDVPPQPGAVIPARISFPMVESTLVIATDLVIPARHEDVDGFDFHELSARNRRVLRHYLELSMDGKLGDAEGIVSLATVPAAHTPIEWPLNAQPEATELASFRTPSYGAMAIAAVVLAVVGGVLF